LPSCPTFLPLRRTTIAVIESANNDRYLISVRDHSYTTECDVGLL
jgi:hypothetical protein